MPVIGNDPDLAPFIIGVVAAGLTARSLARNIKTKKQLRSIYGPTVIIKSGVVLTPIKVPCDRLA